MKGQDGLLQSAQSQMPSELSGGSDQTHAASSQPKGRPSGTAPPAAPITIARTEDEIALTKAKRSAAEAAATAAVAQAAAAKDSAVAGLLGSYEVALQDLADHEGSAGFTSDSFLHNAKKRRSADLEADITAAQGRA